MTDKRITSPETGGSSELASLASLQINEIYKGVAGLRKTILQDAELRVILSAMATGVDTSGAQQEAAPQPDRQAHIDQVGGLHQDRARAAVERALAA